MNFIYYVHARVSKVERFMKVLPSIFIRSELTAASVLYREFNDRFSNRELGAQA